MILFVVYSGNKKVLMPKLFNARKIRFLRNHRIHLLANYLICESFVFFFSLLNWKNNNKIEILKISNEHWTFFWFCREFSLSFHHGSFLFSSFRSFIFLYHNRDSHSNLMQCLFSFVMLFHSLRGMAKFDKIDFVLAIQTTKQ